MTNQQNDHDERISVREANQGFSKLIARVARGKRFVVTKNNTPVASISPVRSESDDIERRRKLARSRLVALMDAGHRSEGGWTYSGRRDELHDRRGD